MAKEQVSSVARTLDILECFMDNSTDWTLKELVQQLQLPTTSVYRHLSTLTARGYLEFDPARKAYQIGPRLLQLSCKIVQSSDIRAIARPELVKLSDAVKETINLSMLLDQEREIFYLDKVETVRSVVCNTHTGSRVPAHAAGCGKVLLAYKGEEYIDAYCNAISAMKPLTAKTITTAQTLRQRLADARRLGYAIDDEEVEEGLVCVGAPIFGIDYGVIASVSIAGPAYRMNADLPHMIEMVKKTAADISRLLGGDNRKYRV